MEYTLLLNYESVRKLFQMSAQLFKRLFLNPAYVTSRYADFPGDFMLRMRHSVQQAVSQKNHGLFARV